MNLKRILRHLTATRWELQREFPDDALAAIEAAVTASERQHRGEICFAVEGALELAAVVKGQTARQRAVEVFGNLRVWDTEDNTGVLIYLLLPDRSVEILADRGIAAKVDASAWALICQDMQMAFHQGLYREGVLAAIDAATRLLTQHFPARPDNVNELPDKTTLL